MQTTIKLNESGSKIEIHLVIQISLVGGPAVIEEPEKPSCQVEENESLSVLYKRIGFRFQHSDLAR